MKRISKGLILAAGAIGLWACGPKASNDPPPQIPARIETSADAGLPSMPLTGKGVIMPSDVKLESGPKPTTTPAIGSTTTATPNAN